jgi:hypothetical protein
MFSAVAGDRPPSVPKWQNVVPASVLLLITAECAESKAKYTTSKEAPENHVWRSIFYTRFALVEKFF